MRLVFRSKRTSKSVKRSNRRIITTHNQRLPANFTVYFINFIEKKNLASFIFHYFKMNKILESEKIYHTCLYKNKDGSNKLFQKGDLCCSPTNSPFWKYVWDIKSGVRTRSQEKKQEKFTIEKFNYDFQNLWSKKD